MKNLKVIILCDTFLHLLEKDINFFLENNPEIKVKDIKYQSNEKFNSAMIIYVK